MAFSIGFFCSHSVHNVMLRRIQNLNGFFYRIFLFTLRAQCDAPTHTKLRWLFYRILLFTLRAQRDAPMYTKLEWLFYRIFLFTLRVQHDAPTYTKTILTSVGLAQAHPNYFYYRDSNIFTIAQL